METEKTLMHRNTGVLLLHPNVRHAIVFGDIRVGNPDLRNILPREIKLLWIALQKLQGGLPGLRNSLGLKGKNHTGQDTGDQPKA